MSTVEIWVVDTAERASKTVVQTFAVTLLALGVATRWGSFWHALDVALLAGVIAVLTSIVAVPLSTQLSPALQVILRAALTFAQSALAFLAANTVVDITSVPWLQVLQVSWIAAATSVLTSWASWNVGPVKHNPSVVATATPVSA